ncbi:MAG: hypothetical protein WCS42_13140 [Verrucomicrobiota bacterium]
MTEVEAKVVEAWRRAAADLGIQFTAPFTIKPQDVGKIVYLGFVHHFGRKTGVIIAIINQPSEHIPIPKEGDYFYSQFGSDCGNYKRQLFIDVLDDWQIFGPDSERPAWYSGKSWG